MSAQSDVAESTGPGPVHPEDDQSVDLGWALTTVLRSYVRAADLALADLPGGGRAYRLLAAVAQRHLPSQLALAESVGLDRTVVTYLLDDLAAAGLVERQCDPSDRRARRIVVTDIGRARLHDFEQRLQQVEQHVLGPLGPEGSTQLRVLLGRAAHAARHADPTTCKHVDAAVAQCPDLGESAGC